MALDACTHLKAWLQEEIELCLEHQSTDTIEWAEKLTTQLWRDLTLSELIQEISFILPATNLEHFLKFAFQNYPRELAGSVANILHTSCSNCA